MLRLALAFLLITPLIIGCSDDDADEASTAVDVSLTTQARGFVYLDETLTIVADPSEAPADAVPVTDAMVRALDAEGEVVAMTLTGESADFALFNLPTGALEITVETTLVEPQASISPAAATESLQRFSITAVPNDAIWVNTVYPVTREGAIEILLKEASEEELVLMTQSTLPVGTLISESRDDEDALVLTAESPVWLAYLDPDLFIKQNHEGRLALLDAETGALELFPILGTPTLNGEPIWDSSQEIYRVVGPESTESDPIPAETFLEFLPDAVAVPLVYQQDMAKIVTALEEGVEEILFEEGVTQALSVENIQRPFQSAAVPGYFAILVQGSYERDNFDDLLDMESFLKEQGVPASQISKVPAKFIKNKKQFASLSARSKEVKSALATYTPLMEKLKQAGQSSTLLYYSSGHGSGPTSSKQHFANNYRPFQFFLDDSKLFNLFSTPACEIQVILDHCWSETFAKNVAIEARKRKLVAEVQTFSATDSQNETHSFPKTAGAYTDLLIKQSTMNTSVPDLRGIALFPSQLIGTVARGAVTPPLVNIARPRIVPGLFGSTSPLLGATNVFIANNPKAYRYQGDRTTCLKPPAANQGGSGGQGSSGDEEQEQSESQDQQQARMEFRNETGETATAVFKVNGELLNGGEPLVIGPKGEPGSRIEFQKEGSLSVELLQFSVPGAAVSEVGRLPEVTPGATLNLEWRRFESQRTLLLSLPE